MIRYIFNAVGEVRNDIHMTLFAVFKGKSHRVLSSKFFLPGPLYRGAEFIKQ